MSERNVSIALLMKLTALAAVNLALFMFADLRPMVSPLETPPGLFIVAALNLVIVQSVILGRPLRAFHFTFLVVGAIASVGLPIFMFRYGARRPEWSLGILESLNGSQLFGAHLLEADRLLTSAMCLLVAWVAAKSLAWRVQRSRNPPGRWAQGVAAFFQGVLIGLGVLLLVLTILHSLFYAEVPAPHTAGWYAHWALVGLSPIVGGAVVCYASRARPG
jgi:uncharacterized membrane protein HdeD (DUF308 family)